jgi:hypothetical protein
MNAKTFIYNPSGKTFRTDINYGGLKQKLHGTRVEKNNGIKMIKNMIKFQDSSEDNKIKNSDDD